MNKDELKKKLTPEQYRVTQEKRTEAPFSGKFVNHHEKGMYQCVVCGALLFPSDAKFDSGTGWPSFDKAIPGAVTFKEDTSHGTTRTEITCTNCGAHLGHVFDDGPTSTGKRYCVNSVCLDFHTSQFMSSIIVKAMLIVRNGDKLLFSRGYDEVKKETFLRPLGGHVEFGEKGEETIRREMQEEVGCDARDVRFVSTIENLFTYNGKRGHEIVLVYEGTLADDSLYRKKKFMFMEGDRETEAGWFSKADVLKEGLTIYPPLKYF